MEPLILYVQDGVTVDWGDGKEDQAVVVADRRRLELLFPGERVPRVFLEGPGVWLSEKGTPVKIKRSNDEPRGR